MSSEAITRNDLSAILNEVLPPTPSEYRKLLWTNPSPTSAFSAQTISLDLSNYDFIEIEMTANKGNTIFPSTTRLPITGFSIGTWVHAYSESSSNWGAYRRVTPSTTGVAFGNGGYAYFDVSSYNLNNNDYGIPLKIYGIKYERVAPPQVNASDYVIEYGTSGIWTYRKWESGIAECWGSYSSSITTSSAFGGWYYRTIGNIGFPSGLFSSTPTITATKNANANGLSFIQIYSVTSTGFTPEVANPSSQTFDCTIAFNAIGRWK